MKTWLKDKKENTLRLKDLNLTYARKIILWSLAFFFVLFLPSISAFFVSTSLYSVSLSIIIYFAIYFSLYVFIYFLEVRTFTSLSIYTLIIYASFSIVLALLSMCLFYILFYTFGHTPVINYWVMVAVNFVLSLVITVLFSWTVQNLYLNSIQSYPNAKAREISIRMFYSTFIRGWSTYTYSDHTVLITRRNIYLMKLFYAKENVNEIIFEHQLPVKDHSKVLIEGQEPSVEFESIDDDLNVKNIKSMASELSLKFELPITPIFILENETMPSVYSKPKNFIITPYNKLIENIKNFEVNSHLKISKHDKIIKELRK